MNFTIIVSLLAFVFCYSQNTKPPTISKTNLRNIVRIKTNEVRMDLINEEVIKIKNEILDKAVQQKKSHQFTIYCSPNKDYNIDNLKICTCKNYVNDDYNYLINRVGGYDITPIEIHYEVLREIRTIFPECHISEYYKNCCNHYNISW